MPGLFSTKNLDAILKEAEAPGVKLRKVLGPVQITLLGIGAIIGAGIFATIGTAAAGDAHRLGAGPGLMLSFVLAGIVCAFVALCYAEFASLVPLSGSAYTYSYATLGELVAWIGRERRTRPRLPFRPACSCQIGIEIVAALILLLKIHPWLQRGGVVGLQCFATSAVKIGCLAVALLQSSLARGGRLVSGIGREDVKYRNGSLLSGCARKFAM